MCFYVLTLEGKLNKTLLEDAVEDALLVGGGEVVVDGETDDGVGHAGGVGQVLAGGAGQPAQEHEFFLFFSH